MVHLLLRPVPPAAVQKLVHRAAVQLSQFYSVLQQGPFTVLPKAHRRLVYLDDLRHVLLGQARLEAAFFQCQAISSF